MTLEDVIVYTTCLRVYLTDVMEHHLPLVITVFAAGIFLGCLAH